MTESEKPTKRPAEEQGLSIGEKKSSKIILIQSGNPWQLRRMITIMGTQISQSSNISTWTETVPQGQNGVADKPEQEIGDHRLRLAGELLRNAATLSLLENDVTHIRQARKSLDADIKLRLRITEPDFTKMPRPRCSGNGAKDSSCGQVISANKIRCLAHQEEYLIRVARKAINEQSNSKNI